QFEEWIGKYGDIVGFYNGAIPVLLIKDLDLIKKIQITDFSNFHDRGILSVENQTHEVSRNNLINASGDHWRKMRRVLTSAFTPSKMQKLENLLNQTCNEFMEDLKFIEGQKKELEITQVFQKLCLKMTVRSAFGDQAVKQLSVNGMGMELILKELYTFIESLSNGWEAFIFNCFPELCFVWRRLQSLKRVFKKFPQERVLKIMLPVINARRLNPEKDQKDMLQLLLDAEAETPGYGK
ncbi:unnamed protein product, partial [Ixodes pacificus]